MEKVCRTTHWRILMSGQAGIRGYLIQTLIGLLEALKSSDWKTVSLEPSRKAEKVDILWTYANGKQKAVQVKSSQNQIRLRDARAWSASLERNFSADEYELQLIGPCAQAVINARTIGRVRISPPQPMDIDLLLASAAHYLDQHLYLRNVQSTNPQKRELIIAALATQLTLTAVFSKIITKKDLDDWIVKQAVELIVREQEKEDGKFFEGPGATSATPISHFSGRDEEFRTLCDAVLNDKNDESICVVVSGLGGVGKTALVQQFISTVSKKFFPDGSAWLDGTDLPSEIVRLADRLGLTGALSIKPLEILRWLSHMLHQRKFIIVVDGLDQKNELTQYVSIPGGQCRTIITTRIDSLHEEFGKPAKQIRLVSWRDRDSRIYFRSVSPGLANCSDMSLDELARFVGGLPLAVRLISKLLLRANMTPESLLGRLKKEPIPTLERGATGLDRGILATFMVAFNDLSAIQKQVFVASGSCARATATTVVSAVSKLDEDDVQEILAELVDRSLLDFIGGANRPWGMHDVVRIFIRQLSEFKTAFEGHLSYVASWILSISEELENRSVGLRRSVSVPELVEIHVPEFVAALNNQVQLQLAVPSSYFFKMVEGYLCGRIPYSEMKRHAQEVLALQLDEREQVDLLVLLGKYHAYLGERNEEMQVLQRALSLAERHSMPEAQAAAHNYLGYGLLSVGRASEAVFHFQRFLSIAEGSAVIQGQCDALAGLAACHRTLGQTSKAIGLLEQAYSLARRGKNRRNELQATLQLAHCRLSGEKNAQHALELYREVFSLSEEFDEQAFAPVALSGIGNCHEAMGDPSTAISFHRHALAINEKLGKIENQAHNLVNMSRCQCLLGESLSAVVGLERALAMFGKIGSVVGQMEALKLIVHVYSVLGRHEDADKTTALVVELQAVIDLSENK